MDISSKELLRIDSLTGCQNYLGFLEALADLPSSDSPRGRLESDIFFSSSWNDPSRNSSILFLDMNHIKTLNDTRGHVYGDSAIRWMGILLMEESQITVYRLGGVEFVILLTTGTVEEHVQLVERILTRIRRESESLDIPDPAAHLALIHYFRLPTSIDGVLMQMNEAMVKVKNNNISPFMVFDAADFKIPVTAIRWKPANESDTSYVYRWISRKNIHQVLEMGRILDNVHQEAYTDTISGLPNMRAALLHLEQKLKSSESANGSLSILLMDGDNIRAYNNINYAAGDEMIRDLCVVLKKNLRPNDFVARWRTGDEFIAILPDTNSEGARIVGERFRLAVKEASQNWRFLTTISIGIASYPSHGDSINALVDRAESALKCAKDQGKDQVVVATD
jgi:diguanylate cyclase (GGDEF)-like protein